MERLGIHFVASPRHADMLLVTGPVTRNMELALLKTIARLRTPKIVVAVGACGISGGILARITRPLAEWMLLVRVDVFIPGCPPRPQALLHGILLAVGRMEQRLASSRLRVQKRPMDPEEEWQVGTHSQFATAVKHKFRAQSLRIGPDKRLLRLEPSTGRRIRHHRRHRDLNEAAAAADAFACG